MSTPDASSDPATPLAPGRTLDYAPAPARRRKWLRRMIFTVSFIALAIASWKWIPPAIQKARILYWQRQCMNYTAPANHVVYEEDPIAAILLRERDSHYSPVAIGSGVFGRPRPRPMNGSAYSPAEWEAYKAVTGLSVTATNVAGAVIFLHERISPSGNRRLVYVIYHPCDEGYYSADHFGPFVDFTAYPITPATLTQPPTSMPGGWAYSGPVATAKESPRIRAYAGQPDPNDASHFTIRYDMYDEPDTVDGWLNDKDQVILTPRTPRWR